MKKVVLVITSGVVEVGKANYTTVLRCVFSNQNFSISFILYFNFLSMTKAHTHTRTQTPRTLSKHQNIT